MDDVRDLHDSNGNSFGDIWWTDKLIYFSMIDVLPSLRIYCETSHLVRTSVFTK